MYVERGRERDWACTQRVVPRQRVIFSLSISSNKGLSLDGALVS